MMLHTCMEWDVLTPLSFFCAFWTLYFLDSLNNSKNNVHELVLYDGELSLKEINPYHQSIAVILWSFSFLSVVPHFSFVKYFGINFAPTSTYESWKLDFEDNFTSKHLNVSLFFYINSLIIKIEVKMWNKFV